MAKQQFGFLVTFDSVAPIYKQFKPWKQWCLTRLLSRLEAFAWFYGMPLILLYKLRRMDWLCVVMVSYLLTNHWHYIHVCALERFHACVPNFVIGWLPKLHHSVVQQNLIPVLLWGSIIAMAQQSRAYLYDFYICGNDVIHLSVCFAIYNMLCQPFLHVSRAWWTVWTWADNVKAGVLGSINWFQN